jgi:hypothetical protein
MIARGFKPVAWVAAVGAAALGCYMLSLRVAAERAELTGLERRIVSTQKAIRSLQTEMETRGRVTQLQQWNDEILALAPPSAGQFLDSQMMLARFSVQPIPALDDPADVRLASAEAPATAPAPSASPAAPAPQRAVAAPRPAAPATVQRASLNMPPPAATTAQPPRTRTASAETATRPRTTTPQRTQALENRAATAQTRAQIKPQPTRTAAADVPSQRTRTAAAPPPRRPAAVPAPAPQRSRALLDERTVRDLGATSRGERRGGTRN